MLKWFFLNDLRGGAFRSWEISGSGFETDVAVSYGRWGSLLTCALCVWLEEREREIQGCMKDVIKPTGIMTWWEHWFSWHWWYILVVNSAHHSEHHLQGKPSTRWLKNASHRVSLHWLKPHGLWNNSLMSWMAKLTRQHFNDRARNTLSRCGFFNDLVTDMLCLSWSNFRVCGQLQDLWAPSPPRYHALLGAACQVFWVVLTCQGLEQL